VIDFSNDWQNNQSSSSGSPSKHDFDCEASMRQQWSLNLFLTNAQSSIDRLILQCWDGSKLKDEEKSAVNSVVFKLQFRNMVRHN